MSSRQFYLRKEWPCIVSSDQCFVAPTYLPSLSWCRGSWSKVDGTSTSFDWMLVLVEVKSFARILTLNRPKQLNALSFQMISRLLELFIAYEEDPNVKLVILKGKGRAFCAGGDVADVVHAIRADLGFFPDVGASYFLSRLPGFFGEYLGLSGARLDGAEMLACGLATHFVPSAKLPILEAALCATDSGDPRIISSIICQYSEQPSLKEQSVYNRLDVIDKCFSQETVEEILSALGREVVDRREAWISATIQTLNKASPTSLKIFLGSIRVGRFQGVGPCLVRDYRMVSHVMRGEFSKDFFEGCRAILLDKDKNPKWEPSKLELVTDTAVDRYFSKVNNEDWEDLKLPVRSKFNLPQYVIAKL
ncbi:hypothetical protein V6N11_069470 [Hibiscus sabdariffa]|uniref:Uncharacterized protein n=2 Tax=Hibiscus sabdariffa TaxID=183260 RepID=A0ABR2Q2V6_9ROSI